MTYYEVLKDAITIELMLLFAVAYFFLVWFCLIVWVAQDIMQRTHNVLYQLFCILLIILFTPLGVVLYLLARPHKSSIERYAEEIEGNLEILKEIIAERINEKKSQIVACRSCKKLIESSVNVCPYCMSLQEKECENCHEKIPSDWNVCPYCLKN